ncbi:tyrosine-type DNA invertase [Klebsiella michiganensis]|uniref:tyrosine-type DNA invertase n=1 Tax=Klebsiella michiganensis TaxID=1134687 RepID=UPI001C6941AE|nr:tyrosine-type DNA invertase [Klebsiella michiganensis]MDS7798179.1 tyrosine-type DNA invertase [Klebsiella michiganensis]HDY3603562.1 tyrosine-type recombinase/integrase [Klebsiella michiganensis]
MKSNAGNTKRNFLTQNEIEALLAAAKTGPHAIRNYCLTLLCFIHGLRASEICRLRVSDIDLQSKFIYVHRLKRGFSTSHPLIHKEIEALKRWLAIRETYPQANSEWLFLSRKGNPLSRQQFYHVISVAGGNAGLPIEIHPHMLRHSCGFALANMGIDTRLIQDYLGHRNIRHTVWYTASNAGRFYGIWDSARDKKRRVIL